MCGGGGISLPGLPGLPGMGNAGSGSANQTTTTSAPGNVTGAYDNLVSRSDQLSQTPMQQANGSPNAAQTQAQSIYSNLPTGASGFSSGIGSYMSPYIMNALQPQIDQNNRQWDIQGQKLAANATQAGAFGGYRQGIEQAENDRNRSFSNNAIMSQGLQNAYQQAQSQYNSDISNQLQQASGLGALGNQQFNQGFSSLQYNNNLPYMQGQYMSNILQSYPGRSSTSTQTSTSSPLSSLSSLMGIGMAGYGLGGAMNWWGAKSGGTVPGYKAGGLTFAAGGPVQPGQLGMLSDQQLQQVAQDHKDPQTQAAVQAEMQRRAQIRQGGMAGAQSDIPDGGIAALASGGDPQDAADRAAYDDTMDRLMASGKDVSTLMGRGLGGAYDTGVVRPLRTLGVEIPYLPDEFYGGPEGRTSMTPNYDRIRRVDAMLAPPKKGTRKTAAAAEVPDAAAAATPPTPPDLKGIDFGFSSRGGIGDYETLLNTGSRWADKQFGPGIAAQQALMTGNAKDIYDTGSKLLDERIQRHNATDAKQQALLDEQKTAADKMKWNTLIQTGLGMIGHSGPGDFGRAMEGASRGYAAGSAAQQAATQKYREAQMAFNAAMDKDNDLTDDQRFSLMAQYKNSMAEAQGLGLKAKLQLAGPSMAAAAHMGAAGISAHLADRQSRILFQAANADLQNAQKEIDSLTKMGSIAPEMLDPTQKMRLEQAQQQKAAAQYRLTVIGGYAGQTPAASAGPSLAQQAQQELARRAAAGR